MRQISSRSKQAQNEQKFPNDIYIYRYIYLSNTLDSVIFPPFLFSSLSLFLSLSVSLSLSLSLSSLHPMLVSYGKLSHSLSVCWLVSHVPHLDAPHATRPGTPYGSRVICLHYLSSPRSDKIEVYEVLSPDTQGHKRVRVCACSARVGMAHR